MRLLPILALVPLTTAQYFSAGWQPGQPVHDAQDAPAPIYTPGAETTQPTAQPKSLSELFSLNTLLTSPPIASIFERLGINITERVELTKASLWDDRIQLITDDNYRELIVNEPLTEQEEKDRVWIAVISVTAAKQDGISKYLDQVFDSAYNETLHENDLPNVRWGRIDYLNVTYLTTKWNVWQAPYLVVITDRGQSLRFYKPYQLRLRDHALRDFLLNYGWENTPMWKSRYAPGGDREWILDIFATYLTKIYNTIVLVPRWLLFIASGGIASIVINFLHRPSKTQPVRETPIKKEGTSMEGPVTKPPPTTQVKSEPVDEAAHTTATDTTTQVPRRGGRKTRGRKQQA